MVIVRADALAHAAGNRIMEENLVNPKLFKYRDCRRRRACRDLLRNPGDPLFSPGLEYQMNKCEEHKLLEMKQRKSESVIVVLKPGNAGGAKDWRIDRA